MRLTKHHGVGNDFLVLLDLDDAVAVDADVARTLCDRRRGVGADGFIRVSPGTGGAEVTMTLYNADGSLAEMSGNGIRCLAQALARARGVERLDVPVATGGGRRQVRLTPGADARTAQVEVDMGRPGPGPGPDRVVTAGVGARTKMTTVDLGNPHLVLLVDDPGAVDLAVVGPEASRHFDSGVNVEVVASVAGSPGVLDLQVWERGVGITEACGTGACAAAAAAHAWGLVGERVRVRMAGGEVEVVLGDTITLIGPAVFVAEVVVP